MPPTGDTGRYQRRHKRLTPLTPQELERAREGEKARKQWDDTYVTRDEAASIPQEALDKNPQLQHRIEYSRPDWPENRMSATQALGDLKGGDGETTERRPVEAGDLFRSGE